MPSIALPVSLRGQLLSGTRTFSPSSLFAVGEPGVWYDPSDVANLAWRRNLLTWTEQLGNTAVWGYRTATASGGTITASAGGPADHAAVQVATTSGPTVTASVLVKSGTSNFIWLTISPLYGLSNYATAVANLATGQVTKTQSGGTLTGATAGISGPDAFGFYRLTLSAANPTSSMAILIGVSNSATPTIGSYGNVDFTAVGTETIITGGAQLELGSTATDYQRITDVNTEVIERFPTATLYQDTIGTIPVTTPGQAVALMLDKSRGLTLGTELVTNGDFDTDTSGWTFQGTATDTSTAGFLSGTTGPSSNLLAHQVITTVIGKTYRIDITTGPASTAVYISPTTASGSTLGSTGFATSGNKTLTFVATATTTYLSVMSVGFNSNASIDNISVQRLIPREEL